MKLLGISGSLRQGSYATALLRGMSALVPDGTSLQVLTLHDVPLYDGDVEALGMPAGVTALKGAIEAADGVVVVSPEYNFSIPGVLKNALDWSSRPSGQSSWKGKNVLTVTASPGPWGGIRAQAPLREVLSNLGARLLPPPHVAVAGVAGKLGAHGLSDEATANQLRQALAQLVAAKT